jgi:hypothetical protein
MIISQEEREDSQKNLLELNANFSISLLRRKSASKIVAELNLPIARRHVQQIVMNDPNFVYVKRMNTPVVSESHKQAKLENINDNDLWNKTIFSDEKNSM